MPMRSPSSFAPRPADVHHLSPLLAFLAGVLTILSPCVLPLVPIVFASAQNRHPLGPIALGAGLALSFTFLGLSISTIGFSLGLDPGLLRIIGSVLLVAVGLVLVIPMLQHRFELALSPAGNWASGRIQSREDSGLFGQFAIGALLGFVWLPCVGPTLGAASVLAAQGRNLGDVGAVMAAFGFGAAMPLALIGAVSARALSRGRGTLVRAGGTARRLGVATISIGVMILTGADHWLESYLTWIAPDWLVGLTTRY